MNSAEPYIVADSIDIGHETVLRRDLSFAIQPGKIHLVCGRNGSGKSTLLQTLLGDKSVLAGTINSNLCPGDCFYLPQSLGSHFHLPITLRDVVNLYSPNTTDDKILSIGFLESIMLDRYWPKSSGGEKMKTLLSVAVLRNAKVLYLDEPTNHLDQSSILNLAEMIGQFLSSSSQRTIVLVSHDRNFCQIMADTSFPLVSIDLD